MGAEVRVLGPLQVFDGVREVPVGGARERTLLAALAVRPGEGLSADQLIDALWRVRPPRSAAKQLQNHVVRVRKALGGDAIRTMQAGYALGDDIDVDAVRFESCVGEARAAAARGDPRESVPLFAAALAMWRGRPFVELDGWDGATAEAVRLEELRRSAEEEAIDGRLTLGAATESVADAEALVAAEPLREHRWVQLMRALYRSGRQADALRAYQRARETLARELGIEPGPELRATEQAVLAQDEALGAPAAMPPDVAVGLPSGVVTFLVTDIEDSTRLWADYADAMASGLARHDEIVAAAVAAAGGTLLKSRGEGDSTLSVFARATDGIVGALAVRDGLETADWPPGVRLSVRSALHTGEAVERGGDYFGPTLNRAARLRALAVGGQVLVSQATAELTRDQLPDGSDLVELGPFELRDLERPERIFALVEPGTPGRDIAGGVCPYQGLLAFQPEDRDRFFGRDELVKTLVTRLADTRHVAVVAASGSGKSSLVRAGIAASLPPGSAVLLTPGSRPLDELAARLAARGDASALGLRRELVERPQAALTVAGATAADRLTLVVDQLEELFTLGADEAERHAFLDALVEAGTAPGAATAVVVALRADFYGHCGQHPGFAAMISSATVLLGQMRPEELRATIDGPARRAGLRVEPGLVDLVLDDVAHEPGALPLMSHALRETWRRRDGHTLSVAGYRAAGGVRGAIARSAETLYGSLAPNQQATVRNIFVRLTEPGAGADDTAREATRRELVGDDPDPAAVEVLELLADSRLVTITEDGAEVAHEALIREWPRLRAWLDEDRDGLRVLRGLARAADEWVTLDRDPGALYRGARLAAVLEWQAAAPASALTPLEREFVESSRALQEAETEAAEERFREQTRANRRLRRLLAGIGLALVIAVVAGVIALVQRNRAEDATQRATVGRLVSESGVLRDRDRPLSALLAVAANRLDDSAATRGALERELVTEPRLRATLTGRREYASLAYTPDGTELIVRAGNAVDVFDARRGRLSGPPVPLPGPAQGGLALAISPDGKLFATGTGDHQVHVFDVRSRREVGAPMRTAAPVVSVAFSPDGSMLATAAGTVLDPTPVPTERTVQLWDVATRQPLPVSLGGHTASVDVVAFSPDGQLLATGGNDHLVVLHDPRTGATVGTPIPVGSEVYSLAFSPDSSRLAVGTSAFNAFVFDVPTRLQVGSLGAGDYPAVAFSPDGSRLVTTGTVRNTIVWDAATLTPIGTPMASRGIGVAFRPDGHEFALTVLGSRTVTLWNPDGTPLFTRRLPGTERNGGLYSPDGTILAVPDTNAVTLHDARTLQPLGPPLVVPGGPPLTSGAFPAAIAFSRDGTRLAVAGLGATVEFFDVATRRPEGASVPLGSPAQSLAFSPDRKLLAVGGTQGDLYLVDLRSGRRRRPPALSNGVFVAFSPDGRRLVATTTGGEAVVYDHLRRAAPRATPLPGGPHLARFSPDGSLLATGSTVGSVQLRDGHTLRPLGPSIPTNRIVVAGIAFTPDGRLLAVADVLSTVRLVDVASHQPIGDAFVGAGVSAPSFRPDGRVLALSESGGAALVTLDIAEWRADACRLAGRNLTPAESREHLGTSGPRVDACPRYPHPH